MCITLVMSRRHFPWSHSPSVALNNLSTENLILASFGLFLEEGGITGFCLF